MTEIAFRGMPAGAFAEGDCDAFGTFLQRERIGPAEVERSRDERGGDVHEGHERDRS
jgi:hypothetical protein